MNTYIIICKAVSPRPIITHGESLEKAIANVPILELLKEDIKYFISIAGTPDIDISMYEPFDPINMGLTKD